MAFGPGGIQYLLKLVYRHIEENPEAVRSLAQHVFDVRKAIEGAGIASKGMRGNFLEIQRAWNTGRISAAKLEPHLAGLRKWVVANRDALAGTLPMETAWTEMQDERRRRLLYTRVEMTKMYDAVAEHENQIRSLAQEYGITSEATENMLSLWGDARGVILDNIDAYGTQTTGLREMLEEYDAMKRKLIYNEKVLWGTFKQTNRLVPAMADLRKGVTGAGVAFDRTGNYIEGARRPLSLMRREFDKVKDSGIVIIKTQQDVGDAFYQFADMLPIAAQGLVNHRKRASEAYRELAKLSKETKESRTEFDGAGKAIDDVRTATSGFNSQVKKLPVWVAKARDIIQNTTGIFEENSKVIQGWALTLPKEDLAALTGFAISAQSGVEGFSGVLSDSAAVAIRAAWAQRNLQEAVSDGILRVRMMSKSVPELATGIARLASYSGGLTKEYKNLFAPADQLGQIFSRNRWATIHQSEALKRAQDTAQGAMQAYANLCSEQYNVVKSAVQSRIEHTNLTKSLIPLVKVLHEQEGYIGKSMRATEWAYKIVDKYNAGINVSQEQLAAANAAIRENEQYWWRQASSIASTILKMKAKEKADESWMNRAKKLQRSLQRVGFRLGWVGYRMVMMGRIIMRWMTDPIRQTIAALTNWEKGLESTAMTIGLLAATGELTGERQEFLMDTMMRLIEVGPAFQAAFGYMQAALLRLMIEAGEPLIGLFHTLGDFIARLTPLIKDVLVPAVEDLINQFIAFLPVLQPIIYEALPWFLLGIKTTIPALMSFLAAFRGVLPTLAFFAGILTPLAPLLIAIGMAFYFISPIMMGLQAAIWAVTAGFTFFTKTIPITIASLQHLTWSIIKFKLHLLLTSKAFWITIGVIGVFVATIYFLYRSFTQSMEKMRKSYNALAIDMKLSTSSMEMVITDAAGNILYSINRMTGEVTDAQGNVVGTIDWASGVIVDKYGNVIGIVDDATHTFRDSSGNIIGYVKDMADDIDESMDKIASSLEGLSGEFGGLEGTIEEQTSLMEDQMRQMRWMMEIQSVLMIAAINPVAAAIVGIGIAVWEMMPALEEWLVSIGVFEDTLEGWNESLAEVNAEIERQLELLDDLGERLDELEDDMDDAAVEVHDIAEELRDMGIDVADTSHLLDDVNESIDTTTRKSEEFADAIDEYVAPEVRWLNDLVDELADGFWWLGGRTSQLISGFGLLCFAHAAADAKKFSDSLRDVISLTRDTERATRGLGGALGGVGAGEVGVGGASPAVGGGVATGPQYVYVYPSITIESVSGIADLGMVTDAVSEGIADAVRRRKP